MDRVERIQRAADQAVLNVMCAATNQGLKIDEDLEAESNLYAAVYEYLLEVVEAA